MRPQPSPEREWWLARVAQLDIMPDSPRSSVSVFLCIQYATLATHSRLLLRIVWRAILVETEYYLHHFVRIRLAGLGRTNHTNAGQSGCFTSLPRALEGID